MSTEPFIGEIKIFGFYFAPRGYMLCAGQILSIAQNTALFSLIGTAYGGNGQTTFALPDLQGRMPIGQGQGPGLPDYSIGERSGHNTVTLISSNLPAHMHTLTNVNVKIQASSGLGEEQSPSGNYPAVTGSDSYSPVASPNIFMGGTQVSGTTDITGSNIPFSIMNPYLTINYSIATVGIFPSRN
ncbi:MAG: phage tail protein [Flavobacterium sp.]|uniref:phage tail protein n=1 Tax=Flavobacterium sp. TaxID=239 RepID=UPI000C54C5D0|nr:tail fiber protein [Flavobacterium sp.]MBF02059.1 phage tail protein [Flavobacterium sp.]|tara:strand:- start:2337 stop:2891 length:555 start_codon:yes stop_codon:yes gene_type:complete